MREKACRFFQLPFDDSTFLEYEGVRLLGNETMDSYTAAGSGKSDKRVMPDGAHILLKTYRRSERNKDLKRPNGDSGGPSSAAGGAAAAKPATFSSLAPAPLRQGKNTLVCQKCSEVGSAIKRGDWWVCIKCSMLEAGHKRLKKK